MVLAKAEKNLPKVTILRIVENARDSIRLHDKELMKEQHLHVPAIAGRTQLLFKIVKESLAVRQILLGSDISQTILRKWRFIFTRIVQKLPITLTIVSKNAGSNVPAKERLSLYS